jgi:uncharacterized protein (DUF1800 family)
MKPYDLAETFMMLAQNATSSSLRFLLIAGLCAQMALPLQLIAQQPTPQQKPGAMQDAGMDKAMPVEAPAPPQELPMQRVVLDTKPVAQPLPIEQRYQLVLDRFTYGARPGDLDRLRQMGFNKWFEQQLNPWRIDDSALEAKLARYPAMNMPLSKLMELYPDNNTIRQAMAGRANAPGGDAAHAIYKDNEERYKDRKTNKGKTADPSEVEVVPLPKTPAEILVLVPEDRFKAICRMTLPQFRELRKELTPEQRPQLVQGFTPQQMEALAAFNNPRAVVEAEDIQTKLLRDVYSERQLNEVMVDFWLNHFNVFMKKSQQAAYYIAAYDRNAIRPYALGHFSDLLVATATSPAMLNYLDASESVGPHSEYVIGFDARRHNQQAPKKASGLNENYAREVMELHTIGVNGGYNQKDVTELAKVFTGWTVGKQRGMDVAAEAQYDPSKHEPGDKMVMGHKIKSNGVKEGYEALRMLAESPQCARFISTKLAVRFVGDAPPPAMIESMVAAFQQTHGDIRQVLIAMINSPQFFTTTTYRAKVKTPQDFVVSAVRAAGSDVESTAGLASAIADLGMPLFGMQTPNGYSMKTEAWNSTTALVSRMNFAMALATNKVQGVTTNFDALLGPQSATMTAEQKTAALEARLLEVPVSAHTQQAILKQTALDSGQQKTELRQISNVRGKGDPLLEGIQKGPGARNGELAGLDTQASVATGLILGSPEFQRR